MARMANKNSVAVLDESERMQRILDWQLFQIDQAALLYGGEEYEWHPGDSLMDYMRNELLKNVPDEFWGWRGQPGNHPRYWLTFFHPTDPSIPISSDDNIEIEISYQSEQRYYRNNLEDMMCYMSPRLDETLGWEIDWTGFERRRTPPRRWQVGVCMDCLVSWDLNDDLHCWSCGDKKPEPTHPLLSNSPSRIFGERALSQETPAWMSGFCEPVRIPGPPPPLSMVDDLTPHESYQSPIRLVEFSVMYHVDFHQYRFRAKCGGVTHTVMISGHDITGAENLEEFLLDVKARLVDAVSEAWRERDRNGGPPEEEPLADWERELLGGDLPSDMPEIRSINDDMIFPISSRRSGVAHFDIETFERGFQGLHRPFMEWIDEWTGSLRTTLGSVFSHMVDAMLGIREFVSTVEIPESLSQPEDPLESVRERFYGIESWVADGNLDRNTHFDLWLMVSLWYERQENMVLDGELNECQLARYQVPGEFPRVGTPFSEAANHISHTGDRRNPLSEVLGSRRRR